MSVLPCFSWASHGKLCKFAKCGRWRSDFFFACLCVSVALLWMFLLTPIWHRQKWCNLIYHIIKTECFWWERAIHVGVYGNFNMLKVFEHFKEFCSEFQRMLCRNYSILCVILMNLLKYVNVFYLMFSMHYQLVTSFKRNYLWLENAERV